MSKRVLKRLATCICLMICVLFLGQISAFAATIGSVLSVPESGWQRYDDTNEYFYYQGTWFPLNNGSHAYYKGGMSYSKSIGATIKFKFKGSKLRITEQLLYVRSKNIQVKIDDIIVGTYSLYDSNLSTDQCLVFEKNNLAEGVHYVELTNLDSDLIPNTDDRRQFCFDAIDIDSTGELLPYDKEKTDSNLKATGGDSKVDLTWEAVIDATGYTVKRFTTAGGPYTTIATDITGPTYTDTDVTNGSTYYYVVTATANGRVSKNSNEASATPQASQTPPTTDSNLKAVGGDSKVDLTWDAVTNATSYIIKRSTTAGGPYETISTDVTGTTYTDTNVTNGTNYYYIITAIVDGRESGNSNEASATPDASQTPPATEAKLKVVLEVSEALRLSVDDDLTVNTQMSWSSSDPTVATVNEKGIVTALAPGNTVITVKSVDGSYTDYINVLVVENADDYRLAIDLKIGETARLTADDFTNTANITWAPMDSSIANVTSKGKVTALSKGLVLISAKDAEGNIIGRVYVRVRE